LSFRNQGVMSRTASAALFLALALGIAWAQDDGGQTAPPADQAGAASSPDNPQQPPANPPISGIDQPALEHGLTERSFLIPGAQISESVDSNVGNEFGDEAVHGVTRALGSLILQRLWNHYDLSLGYVGGAALYSGFSESSSQVHQFDAVQRIRWQRGQFAVRDEFSYLPEGSFGFGAYGGSGGYELGLGGIGMGGIALSPLGNFFGPGQFGSVGQAPRITNISAADVTQDLTARSSVTAAGSYALVHFTDDNSGFIDSRQTSAQAGYDYQLTRRDQIALIYGFQDFRYPDLAGESFTTHLWHVLYGHRISERMDFIVGGGPQLTILDNPFLGSTHQLSLSGRAELRYKFPKTSLGIFYDHYNTGGSGFFPGAKSDIVRVSLARPITRKWDAMADIGYAHNSRIQSPLFGFGVNATSYQYVYAGAAVHRQLGRNFSVFVSYQFNELAFDSSFCAAGASCNRTSQRHVATIGLDWHPRPIKLD